MLDKPFSTLYVPSQKHFDSWNNVINQGHKSQVLLLTNGSKVWAAAEYRAPKTLTSLSYHQKWKTKFTWPHWSLVASNRTLQELNTKVRGKMQCAYQLIHYRNCRMIRWNIWLESHVNCASNKSCVIRSRFLMRNKNRMEFGFVTYWNDHPSDFWLIKVVSN